VFEAIMAGAAGCVLKEIRASDLVIAIRRVASGQNLLDPGRDCPSSRVVASGPGRGRDDRRFSSQEHEDLALFADGLTNRPIATRMDLAE
jgi:DNA-binding NarL/FixJ family response regulator